MWGGGGGEGGGGGWGGGVEFCSLWGRGSRRVGTVFKTC